VKADLFVPNSAFETLVKQLIQQLEEPAAACVRTVAEELKNLLREVLDFTNEIGRFEELRERVWQECQKLLHERTRAAGEFVQNLINMEVAYINTDNPEFEKIRTGVYRLMAAHQGMSNGGPGEAGADMPAAAAQKPQSRNMKEGTVNVLSKREGRETLKPHYVRVENKTVLLFVGQGDTTPVRQLSLEGCSVKTTDSENKQATVLEIAQPKRGFFGGGGETLQLGFDGAEEAATWSNILRREIDPANDSEMGGSPGISAPMVGKGAESVRLSTDSLSLNRRTTLMPRAQVALTDREVLEANVLRQLLEHYFRLVRTSVLDAVPKAIMLMMVNCVQETLQERLMQHIYLAEKDDAFPALTRESDEVRRRRAENRALIKALRNAIEIMRKL